MMASGIANPWGRLSGGYSCRCLDRWRAAFDHDADRFGAAGAGSAARLPRCRNDLARRACGRGLELREVGLRCRSIDTPRGARNRVQRCGAGARRAARARSGIGVNLQLRADRYRPGSGGPPRRASRTRVARARDLPPKPLRYRPTHQVNAGQIRVTPEWFDRARW